MNESNEPAASRFPSVPALAMTFLLAGFGYACPFLLFPQDHPLNGPVSAEVLNLNVLVAWTGMAHFGFAYEGQRRSLVGSRDLGMTGLFLAGMTTALVVLLAARRIVGSQMFDSLVWVYFIPHFVKAERHFARRFAPGAGTGGWSDFWFPALAFGFLTFVLFGPKELSLNPWRTLLLAVGICLLGLAGGAHRQLYQPGAAPNTLLAFFFIGEGLVWGNYSKYMTPQFRQGVYVFHIAVASFYHYLRSYGFAWRARTLKPPNFWLRVVAVNLGVILSGWIVINTSAARAFGFIFDVQYFTFWVGLHLLSSDLFSWLKHRTTSNENTALPQHG